MITLMDCTLRDGANVVGKGFSAEIVDMVLDGLTACHVPIIEFGNAGGIGAYEVAGFTSAETDQTYLDIAQKYLDRGSQLGMFLNAKRYREKNVTLAKENGLSFLRIGADAGDCDISIPAIRDVKKAGLKAFYSEMKAYLLTAGQLAEEAKKLEDAGLDEITIMDSAGTMLPDQVAEYTKKLTQAVSIPVAANGDIDGPEAALRCQKRTGAGFLMIGRGAFGDPWIFTRCRAALDGQPVPDRPPLAERVETAVRQFELAQDDKGERIACLEARKHFAWYLRGVAHSGYYKEKISHLESMDDIYAVARGIQRDLR